MSVRRVIIELDPATVNVTAFCRDHGVSTWFFWDLRRRYRELGDKVLVAQPRVPHRVANRTPDAVIDLCVEIHKELADAGLDAGAESVWDRLEGRLAPGQSRPAVSTIYRHLRARGFTKFEPRKAPRRSWRRFAAERANQRWQIDATHWELADGAGVEIINVVDDCTRVLIASAAVLSCTTATAFDALSAGASIWGWPEELLSDNGSAFRGFPGDPNPGGVAASVEALGIRTSHSRAFHPQTCGKVERFHQTLKKHLETRPRAADLVELQAQLDAFAATYNYQRPHRAIGRQTPATVWATTPHSGPADHALLAPTMTYHSRCNGGSVWAGQRYRISIGAAWDHQDATIVLTGLRAHVFINGRLARALNIDPNRENQPLRSTERDVPRQP